MRRFFLVALTAMSLAGVVSVSANAATLDQPQTTYHSGQSGNTGFRPGFSPQQGDGGWGDTSLLNLPTTDQQIRSSPPAQPYSPKK